VRDKFSLSELAEPRLHLLTKPGVMVKVMLYELPDIFFRAAIVFCRDVGQLRLKLRSEIYFHKTSLGAELGTVKWIWVDVPMAGGRAFELELMLRVPDPSWLSRVGKVYFLGEESQNPDPSKGWKSRAPGKPKPVHGCRRSVVPRSARAISFN